MPPIKNNDSVLGAIAENFGQAGQVDTAAIFDQIQPVVETAPFRRKFIASQDNVTANGTANVIQWRYRPPEERVVMWKVWYADYVNGDVARGVNVSTVLQMVGQQFNLQVGAAMIAIGGRSPFIVGQAMQRKDAIDDHRPFSVLVPRGAELQISAAGDGGVIAMGTIQSVRLFIEEIPIERSLAKFDADSAIQAP